MMTRSRFALILALAVGTLAGPVQAASPIGGLQEVPIGHLRQDVNGVCSAHPLILVKNFGPGSDPRAYLDAAQACGANVLVYFSRTIADGRIYPGRVAYWVSLVRGHPALYGYLTVKEPTLVGISTVEARALRNAYKRADPSRPVVALLTGLPTVDNWYARGVSDVVMFDWYPITRRGYRAGSCATLTRAAAVVFSRGAGVWLMVQAHQYDIGGKARPTPAQMRRQVIEAVTCAHAGTVIAHIWSHAAYQSDLLRNPALFATFKAVTR